MKVPALLLTSRLFLFASLLIAASVHAQTEPTREQLLQKLDDPVILENATIGTSQNVIVTLDVSAEIELVKKRHQSLHDSNAASNALIDQKRLIEKEETALIADKKMEIDKIKKSVFLNGYAGRARVVDDYDNIQMIQVNIPDADALFELLRNPRVQRIGNMPRPVPAGSLNLPIIGQPRTASSGKTGANTRVAAVEAGLYDRKSSDIAGKIVDAIEWHPGSRTQAPLCIAYGCSAYAAAQIKSAQLSLFRSRCSR